MVFMDTAADDSDRGHGRSAGILVVLAVFQRLRPRSSIPFFANWTWGGGWLSQLGRELGLGQWARDFAGSSVVHMKGGVIALVGAWLIGSAPR